MKTKERKTIRCAIYTRKSTEEGLEQEFNSLDAQRESGEAYIKSQASEGWTCLVTRYDDGGYTGGNTDRPALQRLMADIEAGLIDCVVVYKVDRLSRSLLDFSQLLSLFDKREVAFVSVTQSFNTADSAGRLMLHILLSFAEYERSMISERTRDKMSAARRKGKYVGGTPILGYDVDRTTKKLVVNEAEADQVRQIFELYAEHEALLPVVQELASRSWTNKRHECEGGAIRGGKPFHKASVHKLLTNVTYIGKATYKGELFDGEQPAIVPSKLWKQVQTLLSRNSKSGGTTVRQRSSSLLRGLLHCSACNCAMVPTFASKGMKRYHYYVCSFAQKRGWDTCPSKSIPAGEVGRIVVEQIQCIGQDPALIRSTLAAAHSQTKDRQTELQSEQRRLQREAKRATPGELERIERRLAMIDQELLSLERSHVTAEEVSIALADFETLWQAMTPREQARVLELLVERIDYHGGTGKIGITFRPSGIRTLIEQFATEDAA